MRKNGKKLDSLVFFSIRQQLNMQFLNLEESLTKFLQFLNQFFFIRTNSVICSNE